MNIQRYQNEHTADFNQIQNEPRNNTINNNTFVYYKVKPKAKEKRIEKWMIK